VPVAHSYSGGRDQEDHSSKPAREIVLGTLSQNNSSTKRLVELKLEALSLNPSSEKKKKIKKKKKDKSEVSLEYITAYLLWWESQHRVSYKGGIL
jgi:hypothetical protein